MTYRNLRTGAVITTECVITGANWEELAPVTVKKTEPKEENHEIVTEEPTEEKPKRKRKS